MDEQPDQNSSVDEQPDNRVLDERRGKFMNFADLSKRTRWEPEYVMTHGAVACEDQTTHNNKDI